MAVAAPALLRDRLVVKRTVKTPDGAGGWTEELTVAGNAFGRIVPALVIGEIDQTIAGKLAGRAPYRAFIDARNSVGIKNTDVLADASGKHYFVVAQWSEGYLTIAILAALA